jgi:hypothetical protein
MRLGLSLRRPYRWVHKCHGIPEPAKMPPHTQPLVLDAGALTHGSRSSEALASSKMRPLPYGEMLNGNGFGVAGTEITPMKKAGALLLPLFSTFVLFSLAPRNPQRSPLEPWSEKNTSTES